MIFSMGFMACGGSTVNEGETENNSEETVSLTNTQADGPSFDVPFPVWSDAGDLKNLFEQKNDSTYVINFWATWCKPCVKELPYLEKLNVAFKDQKVRVILVSLDFDTDVETKLKSFVEENKLQSDVIAFINGDYNSWIGEIEDAWDGAIPATIIYNAKERKFISGELDSYEALTATVNTVIAAL